MTVALPGEEASDPAARLGILFDAHHQRLHRLARGLSANAEEASDLVQETFLRAARSPNSVPAGPGDNAEAWLVRVLVNIRRDEWRRTAARRRLDPEGRAHAIHPNPGALNVIFRLQEPGAAVSSSEEFTRSMAVNGMEQQRALAQGNMNGAPESVKKQLRQEIARLDKTIRMARARRLIDSKFEMQTGETVVVGASKLGGGDKGLVVLLTAVPAGK
jgi:DNA-directed RNA polymerase specialized sigma24 family protein